GGGGRERQPVRGRRGRAAVSCRSRSATHSRDRAEPAPTVEKELPAQAATAAHSSLAIPCRWSATASAERTAARRPLIARLTPSRHDVQPARYGQPSRYGRKRLRCSTKRTGTPRAFRSSWRHSRPEPAARDGRALRERRELRPDDFGIDAARSDVDAETAIDAGHDVVAADKCRIPLDALRDELRVLDVVGLAV